MVGPLNLYKAPRGTVGGQNNASILSLPTLVSACITDFGQGCDITERLDCLVHVYVRLVRFSLLQQMLLRGY